MFIFRLFYGGKVRGRFGQGQSAFATAFGWNEWILAVIGYILGWLLLSKSFWEGVRESKEELAEEDRREEERKRKEGK